MFKAIPGKWISTGTDDLSKAELWAANYEVSLTPLSQISLRDFSKDFFLSGRCPWLRRMHAKGKTFTARHLGKMRGNLENYIWPAFGDLVLPAIQQRDIDDYLIDLRSIRDPHKQLKSDAKNKIIATFRHIMREAVSQGLIERDPTIGIVPFQDIDRKDQEVFSPDELKLLFPPNIDAMVRIWGSLEWTAYFLIMGSCGLRPQEVGALTWGKWIRTMHGLAITHKIDPDSKQRIKGTKTGISKASLLPRRAEELLLLLESTRENTEPDSLIFIPQEAAGGISAETSNKHFKASCERAGIARRDRTQYNLRHSFNTHALQLLDRHEVQSLMGHQTNAMTQRYDHPTDQQLVARIPQSVIQKIDKLWDQ